MRTGVLTVAVVLAACGGGGSGDDDGADDGDDDASAVDAPGSDGVVPTDGVPTDGVPPGDGPNGSGGGVLFQCNGTGGGICAMDSDGGNRRILNATGFVPHALSGDATVYFHTGTYRVTRRRPDGTLDDLGDGAFVRPQPDGRLLFQCTGLNGGICRMSADGSNRTTVRATGRVPDADATGRILLHSDAYRVIVRDAAGNEDDLGDGAFPTWTSDGRILFQCTGLGGGLCRMTANGASRETLSATGRVPTASTDGSILFHTDAYAVSLRTSTGTTSLGAGANAVWW